ncbi:hypothetical protein FSOLCH5_008123 [Fusarium solani]|uniref:uncharacterized protein n=1 Tax=Fusarium solani TaxID=169388 RepID=UPI002320962D|nr:hypothetical protein MRS44_011282 [Fusarium solani]KAJ4192943.1 hypothetical protein NW759_016625 [Fusarium solani]
MCNISYTAARCIHCDSTLPRREQGRVQCEDVRKGRRCQGQTSAISYSDFVCNDCFQEQAANDNNLYTTTKSKKK